MKGKIFLLVLVCLFSVSAAKSQTGITIDEDKSSLVFNAKTIDVSLVLRNDAPSFDSPISLEILDEKNAVRSQSSQPHKIKNGERVYKISLPAGEFVDAADVNLIWYRLRCRVGNSEETISLSKIIKNYFELRVAATESVFSGQIYRARIRAVDPLTKSGVKNVRIEGELELEIDTEADENELIVKAKGETNAEGFAILDFKIPENIKFDEDKDLRIKGRKNGIVREIDEDLDSDEERNSVFITMDKPMYQPGQSFNIRGLYMDANKTVISGGELEFSIIDGDGTTVYRETVKTSEFGIASISWKIPDNAKLGDYSVEIESEDGMTENNRQVFKVSRYDLPNFAVTAKPDKTFYLLADDTAEITVSADYLFGKPVTKGKVRVVQENERTWSWREQKYVAEEKQSVEGATDAEGKFIAKVDLKEEMEQLRSRGWQRFEDLNFAAYFTDLTTNRTEQRRFDVRLTKEAIHVYLIGNRDERNPDLPFTAYVSTFYADGKPAICDVEIKASGKLLGNLKTNLLGGGKTVFEFPKDISKDRYLDLNLTARDKNGQTGSFVERNYLNIDEAVKIELEKTIFKPGESIKINLSSTKKSGYVYLDIVKDWTVVESRFVKFENGKADVKIPYNPQFKGELTIGVYDDEAQDYYYGSTKMRASRGIIFPEQQNLKLDAEFSNATYKPGEEAKIKFSIFDGAGKAIESALGVVVFDKAIEERARTDAQFGSYFSRYYGLLGYSKAFGGVTLKDLNDLDLSKPIAPELQLAAEIMLAGNYYYPRIYHSRFDQTDAKYVYGDFFKKQLTPIDEILKKQFKENFEHPTDEISLRKILAKNGINFDELRDPWGEKYAPVFEISKTQNILTLKTSGADKKIGTPDDFSVSSLSFEYFTPTGRTIDEAVKNYHQKTGKFVRDLPTLSAALAERDFDLSKLKDRWNRDYRIDFLIVGRNYQIAFRSAGADGFYEWDYYKSDDFNVWTSSIDYFAETDISINKIFSQNVNGGRRLFPKNDAEFKKILKENGLDFSAIRDGYGNPVYLTFDVKSRYADKMIIENGKQKITPVTEEVLTFYIRSRGISKSNMNDDFTLTTLAGVLSEQSKTTGYETKQVKTLSFSGANGAIRGTVSDQTGAFIPNVTVTATDENDSAKIFTAMTNDEGKFLLENLPSGSYTVKMDAAGFITSVLTSLQVRSQNVIEISVTLQVGGVSEMVSITSDVVTMDTTETKAQSNLSVGDIDALPKGTAFSSLLKKSKAADEKNSLQEENSTPRLREYFPETLVWNPELITDKKGRAEMKFKMADNITTWKLYTVASTKNGKIGIAEKEVQAFQPFFVDLEPPKFLTDGDEIFLPTQIRNYTDKKQKVDVSMTKSDWFDFLSSEKQQLEVASGESENAVFGFKANGAIKNGKQKVTAIAAKDSDAIEKPVTVKPNGQEIVKTESKLFSTDADFQINFPANALAKTPSAELKIYPNLFSHVSESVEGLLQRPYGCGEQTISSTYPNLMILKFTKEDNKLHQTAQSYLQKGYERLIGYQVSSGGFSYWGGKEEADIALTAYAIRFLNDADGVIEVDENVIEKAQNWLIAQQNADGGFTKKYYYETSEDTRRTKMFTSYVARTLAMLKAKNKTISQTAENALQKSLAYLKTRNAEIDEPYALALFGLASSDAGNIEDAKIIAEKLETMAMTENDSAYWNLETNTPFYGWGTPGRIETTALVLQLLIKTKDQRPKTEDLISRGTMFLLKNKDRYGVWYSTQTTINVLDAFLAALSVDKNSSSQQRTIQILLNGTEVKTFVVTPEMIAPLTLDLKDKLNASANIVEIKSAENSPLMAQIVQAHYIDWRDSESSNRNTNESRQIRLDYKCDNQTAAIMQEISCAVEAERVGFKGYGMLLAEIGIPPGADVSRESLQAALDNDWSLSRYDILPDRIILYMWSKAGGTKFNFKFRPRYGINAQTPASVVYDYYNDEARGIVAPLKFTVK